MRNEKKTAVIVDEEWKLWGSDHLFISLSPRLSRRSRTSQVAELYRILMLGIELMVTIRSASTMHPPGMVRSVARNHPGCSCHIQT